jgi:hypothetical protein
MQQAVGKGQKALSKMGGELRAKKAENVPLGTKYG